MEAREAATSRRLVAAAVAGALGTEPDAHLRSYFERWRDREQRLRSGFIALRLRFDRGEEIAAGDLSPRIRELATMYGAGRFPAPLLPRLSEVLLRRLREERWWSERRRHGTRPHPRS
jgi:hypothetical protein